MQQLSTAMPVTELVAIHNARASTPITTWKRGKDQLIERIEALPPVALDTETRSIQPLKGTNGTTTSVADTDAASYAAAVTLTAVSDRDSIQVASEKLLEAVAYRHDGRNWGIPYNLILAEVRRAFPDCKTTVPCLRWYAAKMNEVGTKLPQRKRSKS